MNSNKKLHHDKQYYKNIPKWKIYFMKNHKEKLIKLHIIYKIYVKLNFDKYIIFTRIFYYKYKNDNSLEISELIKIKKFSLNEKKNFHNIS